jgi:hypothetical protein
MKNIHLLPTVKPSRLFKVSGELKLTRNFDFYNGSEYQNIYITSDEEIKEGDWCIVGNGVSKLNTQFTSKEEINAIWKKIILTTDQNLIADGVQSINDEFLEWFVKNPSYESVEVKKRYSDFTLDPFVGYKIIIPQEEPNFTEVTVNAFKKSMDLNLEPEPKQETLEEAIKREYEARKFNSDFPFDPQSFKLGAKWQAERMYSETEVLQLLLRLQQAESYNNLYDWFEQFKKK